MFAANANINKRDRFATEQLLLENDYNLFKNLSFTYFVLIKETRRRSAITIIRLIRVSAGNFVIPVKTIILGVCSVRSFYKVLLSMYHYRKKPVLQSRCK